MTSEKTIENEIKKRLTQAGYWYAKIFANAHTKKGIPDLLTVINGQFVALEIKRSSGGQPTPIQIHNLALIANNGGLALLTNYPQIANQIPDLQNPNRRQIPQNIFTVHLSHPVTAAQAKQIWQHPNGRPTPKVLYSVQITTNGEYHDQSTEIY